MLTWSLGMARISSGLLPSMARRMLMSDASRQMRLMSAPLYP